MNGIDNLWIPGIFTKRIDASLRNRCYLRAQHEAIFFIKALHSGTASIEQSAGEFEGLESCLLLPKGALVLITYNVSVETGLVNGTSAIIKELFHFNDNNSSENSGSDS